MKDFSDLLLALRDLRRMIYQRIKAIASEFRADQMPTGAGKNEIERLMKLDKLLADSERRAWP